MRKVSGQFPAHSCAPSGTLHTQSPVKCATATLQPLVYSSSSSPVSAGSAIAAAPTAAAIREPVWSQPMRKHNSNIEEFPGVTKAVTQLKQPKIKLQQRPFGPTTARDVDDHSPMGVRHLPRATTPVASSSVGSPSPVRPKCLQREFFERCQPAIARGADSRLPTDPADWDRILQKRRGIFPQHKHAAAAAATSTSPAAVPRSPSSTRGGGSGSGSGRSTPRPLSPYRTHSLSSNYCGSPAAAAAAPAVVTSPFALNVSPQMFCASGPTFVSMLPEALPEVVVVPRIVGGSGGMSVKRVIPCYN